MRIDSSDRGGGVTNGATNALGRTVCSARHCGARRTGFPARRRRSTRRTGFPVLGYNHDGAGHRVLLTSVHVRFNPDDTESSDRGRAGLPGTRHALLQGALQPRRGGTEPRGRGRRVAPGSLSCAATGDAAKVKPSGVVLVGDTPGHAGSRFALNKPAPPPAVVQARQNAKTGKGPS